MKNVLPLPDHFDPDIHDAHHIHEFLVKQGIDVQGVSLVRPYKDSGDNTLILEVESTTEPFEALEEFVPEPSPEEVAEQELEAIDISKADLAQLRQAVGLMKKLMNSKGQPQV